MYRLITKGATPVIREDKNKCESFEQIAYFKLAVFYP